MSYVFSIVFVSCLFYLLCGFGSCFLFFFFFKQKTAYEMRIIDWSSDFCPSDLLRLSGVVSGSPLAEAGTFRRRTLIAETPAYFVDLDGVRLAQGDYLSLLSANSRSQIRRSIREYGAGEPEIAIGAADDIEQWLSEMRALNTVRHADNAWEEPLFRSFAHELVIREIGRAHV